MYIYINIIRVTAPSQKIWKEFFFFGHLWFLDWYDFSYGCSYGSYEYPYQKSYLSKDHKLPKVNFLVVTLIYVYTYILFKIIFRGIYDRFSVFSLIQMGEIGSKIFSFSVWAVPGVHLQRQHKKPLFFGKGHLVNSESLIDRIGRSYCVVPGWRFWRVDQTLLWLKGWRGKDGLVYGDISRGRFTLIHLRWETGCCGFLHFIFPFS